MALPINWFLSHTPKPGTDVDYRPKPCDFDDSRRGDVAPQARGSLRAIAQAARDEQRRLERSYR